MKATINPGSVDGSIAAPSSKSMTQRAFAGALLHHGKTIVHNAGRSDDEKAALQVIQQLGAVVTAETDATVTIESKGVQPSVPAINCGESGLATRLFTPIAALSAQAIKIEGTGTLLQRPMTGMRDVLTALDVSLPDFNDYIPFTVQGPLAAKSLWVDASSGSQLLSGVLFALCNSAYSIITIEVADLKSKPYIDLTLDTLAQFGMPVAHNDYREFYINPAQFIHEQTVTINVEGDWSGAAFLLVAGAIAGAVTVSNLHQSSSQADKALLQVLQDAGADIVIRADSVTVKRSALKAFEFDATHCPDLFPVLAVLAACCTGESYIKGVHRLFHKESNRAESICEMLQDFAVPFSMEDDALCITGVRKLQGTVIESYHDHRIVMAAAVGALRANGPVEINGAGAVNKSYPQFFEDMAACGVSVTQER